ncbi:spore germination protein [Paenibacillus sp. OV219]|uniref:spore germination protein n=1 Tax=Paenibacillus sp. OV219 TaxID=1884377 RepID=UPI0008B87A5C|nr:spore germination protein [Paenibacillus sp. OV219]SEM64104.1 GerA spore germination protein [Paenibacillus sp. OV219]
MKRDVGKTETSLLARTLQSFENCSDLVHHHFPAQQLHFVYFGHLTSKSDLHNDVLNPFGSSDTGPYEIEKKLGQSQYSQTMDASLLTTGILEGKAAIFYKDLAYLYDAYKPESRAITSSESETVISGPQDSLTESLSTNLSLIRRRLKDPGLKSVSFIVGAKTKTSVTLLYLEDVADKEHVELIQSRIESIQTDLVLDTNTLVQYISPSLFHIMPQFLTSVRPDLIVSKLVEGKVVGLMDGSQAAFSAPTTFFEFFSSPEDYYMTWNIGSAIRLLRIIALFITLTATALYVTIVTYHYEMIPPELLSNLMESRNKVPFSPLMEAIIMEITIELLREAGARLPTKIGTTIGTVGGIVIGQAAVQAGITSNILIIAVSISAIASFVIPSYMMSSAIRLLRFAIIILAGFFGNFGLVVGLTMILIELSGLNMFGLSKLYPFVPPKPQLWMDMIIRGPIRLVDKVRHEIANNPKFNGRKSQ